MRIGRISFEIIKGKNQWGYENLPCGCRFVNVGKAYLALSGKNCKCGWCKQYDCECKCPLCKMNGINCNCEVY